MVGNQEQFANSNGAQPKDKKRIEQLMGNLLRAGVILAATIVFLGGMIHLRHGYPVNYQTFQPEPENLRTLTGIFHEAIALHGPGLDSVWSFGVDCDAGGPRRFFGAGIFI